MTRRFAFATYLILNAFASIAAILTIIGTPVRTRRWYQW